MQNDKWQLNAVHKSCLILFSVDLFGIFNKIAIVQSNFDLIYSAIASYRDHFEHLHLNQLTALQ